MVMTAVVAIASVALVPLMSSSAYAQYGYAVSNLENCNYNANFKTHVSQNNAGDDVFVQIQVPSKVCDKNFTDADVTIEDNDGNTCDYSIGVPILQ